MAIPFVSNKLLRSLSKKNAGAGRSPLDSAKMAMKLFVQDPSKVETYEIVRVFHRWIQDGELEDEKPIDVVSYRHVPNAPWVMLVCTEGQYSLEARHDRVGLRYLRTRPDRRAPKARFQAMLDSVHKAADLLERDTPIRFLDDEIELEVADRLLAPNDERGYLRLKEALEAIAPNDLLIEPRSLDDPRALLRVGIAGSLLLR
jgi:hypothetical protein